MTRVALLDVNVLVALFDPDHVHHEAAHVWFAAARARGWATCPLTENGLVRVLSNPAYTAEPESAARIAQRLRAFCESGQHVSWPDDVSLRDGRLFAGLSAVGHRMVTDVYLLGLAVSRGGRLATFDRRIPASAVSGSGLEAVELIPG